MLLLLLPPPVLLIVAVIGLVLEEQEGGGREWGRSRSCDGGGRLGVHGCVYVYMYSEFRRID